MPEMTLVREVKIERVPRDTVKIIKCGRIPITLRDGPGVFAPAAAETEDVVGERFITTNGKMVCIGLTQEVRDAIGLPCGIFQRQTNEIADLSHQLSELQARRASEQTKLRKLSLWQRIKVLFRADPMQFCI